MPHTVPTDYTVQIYCAHILSVWFLQDAVSLTASSCQDTGDCICHSHEIG